MKQVDDLAAKALQRMIKNGNCNDISAKYKTAWSQFLITLELRLPNDITQLKDSLSKEWGEIKHATTEQLIAQGTIPENEVAKLRQLRAEDSEEELNHLLSSALSNQLVIKMFNNMHWDIIDFGLTNHELVTSDAPLVSTKNFELKNAYIILPISKNCIFVAANSMSTILKLKQANSNLLIKEINRHIIERAEYLVISSSMAPKTLVLRHFSTFREPSLAEQLAATRRMPIVDPFSPLYGGN